MIYKLLARFTNATTIYNIFKDALRAEVEDVANTLSSTRMEIGATKATLEELTEQEAAEQSQLTEAQALLSSVERLGV